MTNNLYVEQHLIWVKYIILLYYSWYHSACTAPEILSGQSYNIAVDWWSLGIVMYLLSVGKVCEVCIVCICMSFITLSRIYHCSIYCTCTIHKQYTHMCTLKHYTLLHAHAHGQLWKDYSFDSDCSLIVPIPTWKSPRDIRVNYGRATIISIKYRLQLITSHQKGTIHYRGFIVCYDCLCVATTDQAC